MAQWWEQYEDPKLWGSFGTHGAWEEAYEEEHGRIPGVGKGETYDEEKDGFRLGTLFNRVLVFVSDGEWHTLAQIRAACGGSEGGVAARLRQFRDEEYGGHVVEKRRVDGTGLWEYRLEVED